MPNRVATVRIENTEPATLERAASELASGLDGTRPALVMIFASPDRDLAAAMVALRAAFPTATCLGSTTSGEFTEKGDATGGLSLFALGGDFRVHAGLGRGLKADFQRAVDEAVGSLPEHEPGLPYRTGLLLLDPLSGRGEEATLTLAVRLGANVPLAGGAAGDDLRMQSTIVACNDVLASDAVVVAIVFSSSPLGVGVRHAHRPISRPVEVTRAEGSVVYEVEGRPAWDMWKELTREQAARIGIDPEHIADGDLGGFLLRFEAGLASGDGYKIRAPLSRGADGSLSFACGVPEGTHVRVTESDHEGQLVAARDAARAAAHALEGKRVAGALVFDCICRKLILGSRFNEAIRGVSEELGGAPIAGFETYGEVALDVGDMSGFHNTTSVVLAFPE
jgi:methyl-accepting chemotaxis protein